MPIQSRGRGSIHPYFIALGPGCEDAQPAYRRARHRFTAAQIETRTVQRADDLTGEDAAFRQGLVQMRAAVVHGDYSVIALDQQNLDAVDAAGEFAIGAEIGEAGGKVPVRFRVVDVGVPLSMPLPVSAGRRDELFYDSDLPVIRSMNSTICGVVEPGPKMPLTPIACSAGSSSA